MNFFHFVIFYLAPILILHYLSIQLQKKFIERYKEKIQQKDVQKRLSLLQLLFGKNYHDKELNNIARQIRIYYVAQVVIMIVFLYFLATSV
jgi:hypothetical protein